MKQFTILFSVLLFASYGINAQNFSYNDTWGENGFNLVDSRTNAVQVIYSVPAFTMEDILVNGQVMKNINLPGTFLFNDEGMPNLPGKGIFIAIPSGSKPVLKIVSQRIETIHNVDIAPAPRIPLDTEKDFPLEKNQAVYSSNAFYPDSPAKISEVTQIRGVDAVTLGVTPFQYNPVTKDLIIYKDLKVEIAFEGGNRKFGDEAFRSRWFDPILEDNLLNYSSLPVIDYDARFQAYDNGQRDTECEYIILSPTGSDFLSWADSISNFRNQQGILSHVFTIDEVGGNTETAIASFIDNAYNNWTIKPVACLILADYGSDGTKNITSHIYPHPAGYPSFASDNWYADVTGDEMPDIVFSRITANNNAQLQVMCSKFLDYERNPPTDPVFYDKPITALGWQTERWFQLCSEIVGGFWRNVQGKHPRRINAIYSGTPGSVWSTATNTNTLVNYFGPNGLSYIPQQPSQMPCCWSGGYSTQINQAIDSGAFILIHRDHGYYDGWGEPAYSSNNISQLNNTALPFVFSINCQTGAYHRTSECFGEKFHRHTKNNHNAGALGIVCPTEVSYSFVNDTYVWGMWDNMWPNFMPAQGTQPSSRGVYPAFGHAAGKYFLKNSNWPYNSSDKLVTYRLFHMLGEAFQVVYYEVPQYLTVTHDPEIEAGSTTFNITANDSAFIALTVDNEIIATALGNGSTPVVMTIPPQLPGNQVMVTVTKQNYFRYTDMVPVTSEQLAANFEAESTSICKDQVVNFTDLSAGNPDAWQWFFDGGTPSTSTQQNPQGIVYGTPGNYNVTLTVYKVGQVPQSHTKDEYISVYGIPTAVFSVNATCVNQSVQFTDESSPNGGAITSWEWNFGDPGSGINNVSNLQNPTHTYSAAGIYSVALSVKNNGLCTKDTIIEVSITDIPMAADTPIGDVEFCQGITNHEYTTDATYASSFVWEVSPAEAGTMTGDMTTGTFSPSPEFAGIALIKAKGINDCGEGPFSQELSVTINPLPAVPDKPAGPDTVNVHKNVSSDFTVAAAQHATSYAWSLDPSNAGNIEGTDLTGTVTWNQQYKGTATIVVKGINTCGESVASAEKSIYVYSTLGIADHSGLGIQVFPNPNTGKFTLDIRGNGNATVNITILNPIGVTVFSENNVRIPDKFTRNIDFSKMPDGIYYLKIEGDGGVVIKKIIIQK